jgi:hypothetical protein
MYVKLKRPLSGILCSHYIVEYSLLSLGTLTVSRAVIKRTILFFDYGEQTVPKQNISALTRQSAR